MLLSSMKNKGYITTNELGQTTLSKSHFKLPSFAVPGLSWLLIWVEPLGFRHA